MATFQQRGARWRAIVRKQGHPAQSKSFRTKGQAQRWAKELEDAIANGTAGAASVVTLDDVLTRQTVHLERISDRGRKNKTADNNLRKGLDADMLIRDLDYAALAEYCTTRLEVDQVKPATVKMDVMYLSGAITTCVVEELLLVGVKRQMATWCKGLSRAGLIGFPQDRERRPTAEELETLLVHTQHNRALRSIRYGDLIRFAVASAMRLNEICSLRWGDVDLAAGTVIIRLRKHPKTKVDQLVPLMGESQAILEAQPRVDERVFPFGTESVSNGFRRICQHLEIEDLHFHDLRHEGISRLFEQGYQIQEVAMVSGHRDWKSLKRYVNLKPGELSAKDRKRVSDQGE